MSSVNRFANSFLIFSPELVPQIVDSGLHSSVEPSLLIELRFSRSEINASRLTRMACRPRVIRRFHRNCRPLISGQISCRVRSWGAALVRRETRGSRGSPVWSRSRTTACRSVSSGRGPRGWKGGRGRRRRLACKRVRTPRGGRDIPRDCRRGRSVACKRVRTPRGGRDIPGTAAEGRSGQPANGCRSHGRGELRVHHPPG